MRYRKHIYCEKDFIKLCIDKIETCDVSCSPEELLLLKTIKSIVSDTYTKLYLDMSSDEIDTFSKDIYKRKLNAAKKGKQAELSSYERYMYNLFWMQQNQEVQIRYFDKIDFENSKGIDLNAYYFTCKDSDQCRKAMNSYGVLALNFENIKDFAFVLNDNGGAISKNTNNTWKTIFDPIKRPPFNSLIIIDNYILNDTDVMEENLGGIISSLLPDSICVPFEITIFSKLRNDKGNIEFPCEPRYDKILELLPSKPYEIKLSIIKCQSFHDRVILTNSMFIGCPSGFNLFKNMKSEKTTYYNMTAPFLADGNIKWTTEAYSNYIADAAPVFRNSQEYGGNGIGDSCPQFYLGKKENRIIDGYIGVK